MSFEKHEKEIENDYCCYWATACFLYVGLRVRTAYAGLSTRKLVSATRRIGGTSEPLKKKEELPNNPCAAAAPSLPYRWSHRKSRPPAAASGAVEEASETAGRTPLLRNKRLPLPHLRRPLRRSGSARPWPVRAPPSPREATPRASSTR
jgi:hypothetical protein